MTLASSDKEAEVRREASKYLKSRDLDISELKALEERLYKETDITTAVQLIDAIFAFKDREESRKILLQFNKTCGHPQVCKKLESILIGS